MNISQVFVQIFHQSVAMFNLLILFPVTWTKTTILVWSWGCPWGWWNKKSFFISKKKLAKAGLKNILKEYFDLKKEILEELQHWANLLILFIVDIFYCVSLWLIPLRDLHGNKNYFGSFLSHDTDRQTDRQTDRLYSYICTFVLQIFLTFCWLTEKTNLNWNLVLSTN